MKSMVIVAEAVFLLALILAPASYAADPAHQGHASSPPEGQVHQGRGVVEAIDPAKGLVTLEHEAIPSLRWPKMVMDFKARDKTLLKDLKEGDQIAFDLAVEGKEYTITRIEPLR